MKELVGFCAIIVFALVYISSINLGIAKAENRAEVILAESQAEINYAAAMAIRADTYMSTSVSMLAIIVALALVVCMMFLAFKIVSNSI